MPLPEPKGLQREVLSLPGEGHFVVLGTAGSGKTTLAILRATYLARRYERPVLLVTFNRALVTYINTIGRNSIDNVDVRNFHRVARGYLSSQQLLDNGDILENKDYIIEEALDNVRRTVQSVDSSVVALNRIVQVFSEEIQWLQRMGISNLEEYEGAERIGRASTRIERRDRRYFYQVYQEYVHLRNERGYRYDWDDLALHMDKALEEDDSPRHYAHVVIDEGQDLSPAMLRALSKLVPTNGSLTFFGDVAQQIYGSRISWRNAGLSRPRTWKFQQNYRNTKQIAAVGVALSNMPFFSDDVDLVEPVSPRISGPLPGLVGFANLSNETDFILDAAIDFGRSQSVAVLVRDRETVNRIARQLGNSGESVQILRRRMTNMNTGPGISVGTYHSAKGLEFDAVLLPFCDAETLPNSDRVVALEGEEEAMKEEIKLLYVGVTRARTRLIISYTGRPTRLLPYNQGLFQEFQR